MLAPVILMLASSASAQPPVAHRGGHVDDYHGVKVADPYRWMEDLDSSETRKWIAAENAYTASFFSKIPERERLRRRMTELSNYDRTPPYSNGEGTYAGFFKRGGRYFWLRHEGLKNQPVLYVMPSLHGTPRVLLDPNPLASDGTAALADWSVSNDGKWLVYGISKAGSDWQDWRVRDVETAKDTADHLEWIKFSSASWSADGKGFYYSSYPKPAPGEAMTGANFYNKLYYHRLGTPQEKDQLIYERPDQKEWRFDAVATPDGQYLVFAVRQGTRRENLVFYQDLKKTPGKTIELISDFYAGHDFLGNDGARFYFSTNYHAPHGRIVAIDLARPGRNQWKQMVAELPERLESAEISAGRFVTSYLRDASSLVRIQPVGGDKVDNVRLPGLASVLWSLSSPGVKEQFYSLVSYNSPGTVYSYDLETGESKLLQRGKLPFDPDQFETRQVFFTSQDGTRAPMFVSSKKGLKLDGNNPTLLTAYGGFDISNTPQFRTLYLGWMEIGGVVAVATLRGGGEYGEEWHAAGMRERKQNVFDDFIAAGEWLIANKYTSTPKLAIIGGSNGGLLIGACLNERPDLFGAAIPAVGVMDMLRFQKFTAGPAWVPEYGTAENPEDFKFLYAYSPLHNIHKGTKYPPTLIITADHDDRVVPSHSFKYAATLQRAQGGAAPILIRIETSAGHGAGKPTSKRIEEDADVLAFLVKTLGVEM